MNKGIYIHYPFCDAKCLYCDFFSVPDMRKKQLYEEKLAETILSFKEDKISADTVFFGGGTPSLMSREGAEKVFSALRTAFNITPDAEITLEANPSRLEDFAECLSHFKALGVNRLSLGVQSLDSRELEALGRRHTPSDAEKAVDIARKTGFDNISLDLMVRIPHQTEDSLGKTLEKALALSPDHLSLYTLSIEEKTVFGARYKKGDSLALADEDTEEKMWETVCDILSQNGFRHYEISNFAKPQKESRHNLKYWKCEEYLGFGAAAHSYYKGERFSYPKSIDAFIENPLRRDSSEKISQKMRSLEYVMLSSRLDTGIDLDKICPTEEFFSLAEALERGGLAKLSPSSLTLTERGWRVSNTVIEKILESLNLM